MTAHFLCEIGGAAEKVILDWHDSANEWRAAVRKVASAAFKREVDGMLMAIGHWFRVPLLEGEAIPKGWLLDRCHQHELAPHGLARPSARVSNALKLPAVPYGSQPQSNASHRLRDALAVWSGGGSQAKLAEVVIEVLEATLGLEGPNG
jgi:hypothetical protein